MGKTSSPLIELRRICLALPDTKETLTWGTPHFRVGEKIFAGYGDEDGKPVAGFKLEKAHADAVIERPGFWRAPYVGQHGWVSMDVSRVSDWSAVREMILESYGLIAPRKSLAKLEGAPRAPRPEAKSRSTAKSRSKSKATGRKR